MYASHEPSPADNASTIGPGQFRPYCREPGGSLGSSPTPPTSPATGRRFLPLLFSIPVLKGKDRFCDVCGNAIVKGEKYAIVTVSKDNAELFHALTESEPGMAPTISVDSRGNVRLDLWLGCRLNTRFPGDQIAQ